MPLPDNVLTICGIPELPQHADRGVTHVLSIIDTYEPRPIALDNYPTLIERELIRFDDVVAEYPGFAACTPEHIEQVLAFGERVQDVPGAHVLVHCHAGISRSTAAAAMMRSTAARAMTPSSFAAARRSSTRSTPATPARRRVIAWWCRPTTACN